MDQWERMLDVWYETVGYDSKTGKPTRETLKKLGLDWLAKDLWAANVRRDPTPSDASPSKSPRG